jgi:hypothetical protein
MNLPKYRVIKAADHYEGNKSGYLYYIAHIYYLDEKPINHLAHHRLPVKTNLKELAEDLQEIMCAFKYPVLEINYKETTEYCNLDNNNNFITFDLKGLK